MLRTLIAILCLTWIIPATAAEPADTSATHLDEVEVVQRRKTVTRPKGIATDTQLISASELLRAACCNLGESFTTNPSVDVSYNDAATGARQIKLLGLSGAYVQTLTENTPSMRILALPYGLSYIPGPWIQSIAVSKGAASVKNGREAITGQVDVELKKPQLGNYVEGNAYFDSELKGELNAAAAHRFGRYLSSSLLLHGEHSFMAHDANNDGFADMPRIDQVSVMNRWAYLGRGVAVQGAVKYLGERRRSGTVAHHGHAPEIPFEVQLRTQRLEGWAKAAYIFDKENDGNIAFIFSGNSTGRRDIYGRKQYRADQSEFHAVGMFERKWNSTHAFSSGISLDCDNLSDHLLTEEADNSYDTDETVAGAYVQYTWTPTTMLTIMSGLRYDYSWLFRRSMLTPRLHLRWSPTTSISFHAAAGRGLRTAHVLAEYSYLLGSPRHLSFTNPAALEDAWNAGGGCDFTLYPFSRSLTISVEYYWTGFRRQLVANLYADGSEAIFEESRKPSRSHTAQIEATWSVFSDFSFTAAYRYTDARTDYGNGLIIRPFTPHHKALFTASYTPMMGLWLFDVTCTITGSGRFPASLSTEKTRYPAFAQLNAQASRVWRHFSIYAGVENITGYRQPDPILGTDNPHKLYDATMIYGPLHGAMFYAGVRVNF